MAGGPGETVNTPAGKERRFHFQCLRCGSVLEGRSDQSGRSARCPTCGAIFAVPEMDPRTGLARSNAEPGEDGENPTPMHAYACAGEKAPRIVRGEDDSLSIICPRCDMACAVSADNCAGCGLPFTLEGQNFELVRAPSPAARWAFTLGIVALVLTPCAGIGILAGVPAVISGLAAHFTPSRGSIVGANSGIAMGLIACVVSVLIRIFL